MSWKDGEYQPKQKRGDEKKDRILDAALELFGTKGYHGTTAKAIAEKACVATGSFYRYFRDKKAAFMAVSIRMEADLGGEVFSYGQRIRQEGRPEQEIIASLISFSILAHQRHKGFHREVAAMRISDPDVASWASEREKRLLATFTEFLQPMSSQYRVEDLDAAAEVIYYAIEEVAHRAVLFDSLAGTERLVQELQDMVSRYLFE
jgi:AcrR family transcriptional regulator